MSFLGGGKAGTKEIKLEKSDFNASALKAHEGCRKSGFMTKQGQRNTHSWQRRYFVLNNNCLFYYHSQDPQTYIGMIWVEGCSVDIPHSQTNNRRASLVPVETGTGAFTRSDGFPMTVRTIGSRDYQLVCETESERQEWVEVLKEAQFTTLTSKNNELQDSHQSFRNERMTLEQQTQQLAGQLQASKQKISEAEVQIKAERELREKAREREMEIIETLEDEKARLNQECKLLRLARGISVATPTTIPNQPELGAEGLRIWVGSWNLGAADPFDPSKSGMGTRILRQSFIREENSADIYFLGLQEGISDAVFHATESLLSVLADCDRVQLHESSTSNQAAPGSSPSTVAEASATPTSPPVVAPNSETVATGETMKDKIHGRGDGSLMGTKFTGLALYVRRSIRHKVRVLGCVSHPLEKLGSKGGVAVALNVSGSTIVFVTCHLEAMKRDVRRAQYRELIRSLGQQLGEKDFDLTSQFHHVIWNGDLNYRCVETSGETMAAEKAVEMIRLRQSGDLFRFHDQLNQERRDHQVFSRFNEPFPAPDFLPTYKKYEQRPATTDYSNDQWVSQIYRTRYKEKFYKGGNVKDRTPGYCDRVLFHSLENAQHRLLPERKQVKVNIYAQDYYYDTTEHALPAPGSAAPPSGVVECVCDNYFSVNDGEGMSVSDHSPVYTVFHLHPAAATPSSNTQTLSAQYSAALPHEKARLELSSIALMASNLMLSLYTSEFSDSTSTAPTSLSSVPISLSAMLKAAGEEDSDSSDDEISDKSRKKASSHAGQANVPSAVDLKPMEGEEYFQLPAHLRKIEVLFPLPYENEEAAKCINMLPSSRQGGWSEESGRTHSCRRFTLPIAPPISESDYRNRIALPLRLDWDSSKANGVQLGNLHVLIRVTANLSTHAGLVASPSGLNGESQMATTPGGTSANNPNAQKEPSEFVAGEFVVPLAACLHNSKSAPDSSSSTAGVLMSDSPHVSVPAKKKPGRGTSICTEIVTSLAHEGRPLFVTPSSLTHQFSTPTAGAIAKFKVSYG